MSPASPNPWRRILLVAHPTLGDAVAHTALCGWIKRAWPDCRLVVLTGALAKDVFASSGFADEIWLKAEGRLRLFAKMRAHRFELALFPYVQNSLLQMTRLAGIPHRIGEAGGRNEHLLTASSPRQPGEHAIAPLNRRLFSLMGGEPGPDDPVMHLPNSALREVDGALGEDPRPLAAVMPGASHPAKAWPLPNFLAVARDLRSRGYRVVAVGGPAERGSLGDTADLDLAGQLSVLGSAELLRRASVLVTNDTGARHLARAVGTPSVILYGPVTVEDSPPYGSRDVPIGGDCACPVRALGTCTGTCLAGVPVSAVLAACDRILAQPTV